MNRATKRLLAKQQAAEARKGGGGGRGGGGDDEDRGRRPARGYGPERKKRTPPRQFLREVRTELKKVAWPSRKEVATYTAVVLVSVIFITVIVFGIDYGLSKGVFEVFSKRPAPSAPAQPVPRQSAPAVPFPTGSTAITAKPSAPPSAVATPTAKASK